MAAVAPAAPVTATLETPPGLNVTGEAKLSALVPAAAVEGPVADARESTESVVNVAAQPAGGVTVNV